ncbi:MAG: hypothetical protein AAGA56_01625 [Myxococcota bacterium]
MKGDEDGPRPPPRQQQETLPRLVDAMTETATLTRPRHNADDASTLTGPLVVEVTTRETSPHYRRRKGPQGTLLVEENVRHEDSADDPDRPTSVYARHRPSADEEWPTDPDRGRQVAVRATQSQLPPRDPPSSGEHRASLRTEVAAVPSWLLLAGAVSCLAIGAAAAWLVMGQP